MATKSSTKSTPKKGRTTPRSLSKRNKKSKFNKKGKKAVKRKCNPDKVSFKIKPINNYNQVQPELNIKLSDVIGVCGIEIMETDQNPEEPLLHVTLKRTGPYQPVRVGAVEFNPVYDTEYWYNLMCTKININTLGRCVGWVPCYDRVKRVHDEIIDGTGEYYQHLNGKLEIDINNYKIPHILLLKNIVMLRTHGFYITDILEKIQDHIQETKIYNEMLDGLSKIKV